MYHAVCVASCKAAVFHGPLDLVVCVCACVCVCVCVWCVLLSQSHARSCHNAVMVLYDAVADQWNAVPVRWTRTDLQ
jgi:hypothetical protein